MRIEERVNNTKYVNIVAIPAPNLPYSPNNIEFKNMFKKTQDEVTNKLIRLLSKIRL